MASATIANLVSDGVVVISDEFEMGTWRSRPLNWRILRLDGTRALVTTVGLLDHMPYHRESRAADWGESDVRAWLRDEFAATAFAPEEVAAIVEQLVETPGVEEYESKACPSTRDSVFCLSVQEVTDLFESDAARNTEGDNPCWWLRSPGGADGFAAYVHLNGWVNGFGYNVDEASVRVRPAMVVDLALLCVPVEEGPLVRASEFGSELLLEATETDDYTEFGDFARQFGMDASWQPLLVEHLAELCARGDARPVEEFLGQVGEVEFGSAALAQALAEGNSSIVRLLVRHGIGFSGKCRGLNLVNDTPELRKSRAAEYCAGVRNFAALALEGPSADIIVRQLVRQDALDSEDYRLLLNAAARNEDYEELFGWLLNPDFEPVPGIAARWSNKRVIVSDHAVKDGKPVSAKALRMLWHAGLVKEDPATARCMAPHLGDPSTSDRQELLNACIVNGWDQELQALLAVKRAFTPNMLAAGAKVARAAGKRDTEKQLLEFLRSIGAGRLAAESK